MTKQELLKYAELTWNSIKPIEKYDKNKSTELEGLKQIEIFGKEVSEKEKSISQALQNFITINNISQAEEKEISESITNLFTSFIKSNLK
ncbi:hypothetical protein [Polaribacter sp. 20A6]|uniref:hypothetical protein n=1 Tax=Polaribacter sp. 20A6 TaxID=2687289 RepID=UPI0013FD87FD|nr:hypothetical protein [Polaribacter sp. 20A6]